MRSYMKILGIAALVIGVAGFVLSTEKKSAYEIFHETYKKNGRIEKELNVEKGHGYRMAIWGIDEEMGLQQWGNLTAKLLVTDSKGKVVCDKSFNASASSAQETGGVKRAQNGTEFLYQATAPEKLGIVVLFEEGDSIEMKIFKDIGDVANLLPSLFVILSIAGGVLFLKGRAREKDV